MHVKPLLQINMQRRGVTTAASPRALAVYYKQALQLPVPGLPRFSPPCAKYMWGWGSAGIPAPRKPWLLRMSILYQHTTS